MFVFLCSFLSFLSIVFALALIENTDLRKYLRAVKGAAKQPKAGFLS
jgi:hypothetical protein